MASKAPSTYFSQSGVVGAGGDVSVEESGSSGSGGPSGDAVGSSGGGDCCLVVKALTPLQAL